VPLQIRSALLLGNLALLSAQEPSGPSYRGSARLVIVDTSVTDAAGKPVRNLGAASFQVHEEGKPRQALLDSEPAPLSLVIAVQTAGYSAAALAKLRKVSLRLEELISQSRGEVALIAYDRGVRLVHDFTWDWFRIKDALENVKSGPDGGVLHDAVREAAMLLERRPGVRRRALLFIGESKDRGSAVSLEDALKAVQNANVTVYPVTYSPYLTPFTAKPEELPMPPADSGLNLIGAAVEMLRLGKRDAAGLLAASTGGLPEGFLKQAGLGAALDRMARDLESRYALSFVPEGGEPGQFRRVHVSVRGRPELTVRHRSGYIVPAP
jgi:VWFA-related protein